MSLRFALAICVSIAAVVAFPPQARASNVAPPEPNMEIATQWWPDLKDYWTPVGWKHHRFRYNVFFEGTIHAAPDLSQTAKNWAGQGVQLRVLPSQSTDMRRLDQIRSTRYQLKDDNSTRQGWTTDTAPVLWTEWSNQGLLLRENVFAHLPGGREVTSGTEPLFAWVRLSIHDTLEGMPLHDRFSFVMQVNQPHVRGSMTVRNNLIMNFERARYPRALEKRPLTGEPQSGMHIVEPDGRIRISVARGSAVDFGFVPGDGGEKDPVLYMTVDAKRGRYVDVLVPMVPTEREIVEKEMALGYDGALAEANQYWSERPDTAATIDVPESYINDALHQFERYAQVLSEKMPATGKSMPLSGSLAYVRTWATPTGKLVAMYLDPLGYHDLAAEYLEPFIEAQGTRKPPSSFIDIHPGFLGSPIAFKSVDWMCDHGSLLFAISNHAMMIPDTDAKKRYIEPVVKACEFVRDARRTRGHGGVQGILPPARFSDRGEQGQTVWNDGWNYKGLEAGARFLRQIGHPRAGEIAKEAEDYKKTFLAAFREATAKSSKWTDDEGKVHPFVPLSPNGKVEATERHGFYLDTGPLMLVFAGLMKADDPIMESTLKWFREGPVQRFGRVDWNHFQVGFLTHEMSSSIPGYSWNVFHSHQLGDRYRFLEGMYSQYAGAISRQTKTVCESRGGITGRITHADTPFYLARLAVIDDLVAENELHLLRLCPLAWVTKDKRSHFGNMPTAYGPVTLEWQLPGDGKTLQVTYKPQYHQQPSKVILHIPPVAGLEKVSVNGTVQAPSGNEVNLTSLGLLSE